jgi:protein involved in polysaccharide export with SLBB domain
MSQNIQIEPGDYIYFPSANTDEVFVLGDVNSPNSQGFTPNLTVLAAITQRDGFTSTAYREKVLVVRGSLTHPQLFVVNTNDILKGRKPDFRLEPKDIVYVSSRPWKYAEDLADIAVSAFVETAMTTWTGESFGPFIKHALLPKVRVE